MPPFQDSQQPTHAGQPAGASSSAPDEGPVAVPFDGEVGPPFDLTFLDHWDSQPASQSVLDPGLLEQAIMPHFDAGGALSNWTPNNWTDETFEFSTVSASQSALGPAPNEQMMIPPFDTEWSPFGSNPWMDQPIGLPNAEVASTSALLALGQAPIASDGAASHLQDASFDYFDPAGWTNDDVGMPDASGRFDDPIR